MKCLILSCFLIVLVTCQALAQKFEPKDGKCLVFIGQDLDATGGLDAYSNGYTDYFKTPAGVTIYTNLSPGNESYGRYNQGLDGLTSKANWGAGDSWADLYVRDTTYKSSALAIGLSFVNNEKNIAKGKLDPLIQELANWIKSTKRPVFLRIGYEFDGWSWNHYKKKHYLKAWERIHTIIERSGANNVAYVWQSKGSGSNQKLLENWYPGDDMVDWCAYSYFGQPDQEMLTFARKHKKPVFIAEATPVQELENLYFNSDLKDPKIAKLLWKDWFIPFFKLIQDNSDVIKAFSYINTDWSSQPMWINNPVFKQVDSRIQMSTYIKKKWLAELSNPHYIHASQAKWELTDNK